jgi:hypothetical protein
MARLHRSFAIPVLAAGLVLLAACGSSTSSGEKTVPKGAGTTTTVAKPGDKSKTTSAPTTTVAKGGEPGTTAGGGSSPDTTVKSTPSKGGQIQLSGSFCDMIKQLNAQESDLFAPEQGADPATNLKNLKEAFANLVDVFKQLQAKAPAEIKADVDYTVTAFEKVNDKVQQLTAYTPEALATITGTDFSSPEAQKHSDNVDAYTKNTCGFDPSASGSGGDTAS